MPPLPPYSPVSIYDAPGVIFSSLLDGNATGGMFRAALLDPMSLTPHERDTIGERLKQASGNTAIGNALVDMATNPWVWFMALTSPAGVSMLGRGAKSIFDPAREVVSMLGKEGSFLSHLGMSNLITDGAGTAMPEVVHQLGQGLREVNAKVTAGAGTQYEAALKALGVDSLDVDKAFKPRVKDLVQQVNDALMVKMAGWADTWEETKGALVRGEDGKWGLDTPTSHRRLVPVDIDAKLRDLAGGGNELVDLATAMRATQNDLWGTIANDPRARLGVFRLLKNPAMVKSFEGDTASGLDVAQLLLGDLASGVKEGQVTVQEFENIAKQAMAAPLENKYYMPLNLSRYWGVTAEAPAGGWIENAGTVQQLQSVKPGGMAIGRTEARPLFAPDAYRRVWRSMMGDTEITGPIAEKIAEGEKLQQRAVRAAQVLKGGQDAEDMTLADARKAATVRFQDLNWNKSLSKYLGDTARTLTMVQEPSAEVLSAQANSATGYVGPFKAGMDTTFDPSRSGVRAPMAGESGGGMASVPESDQPMGGFTLADALLAEYTHIPNTPAGNRLRERITEEMLPRMFGRKDTRGLLLPGIIRSMKGVAQTVADWEPLKKVEESGGLGSEFVAGMRNWAASPTTTQQSGAFTSGLLKMLYAGPLSFNASAAITNVMQPGLLLTNWVGGGNVLKAYPKAFKSLLGYMSEAAAISHDASPEAMAMLRERHFKEWTDLGVDLHDLIGMGEEQLHRYGTLLSRGSQQGGGVVGNFIFNTGMKLFEGTEALNRLVTAESVLEAYKGAGRELRGVDGLMHPDLVRDIRKMNQLTQFAGSPESVPWAFQSGGFFDHPLTRQFLQFSMRTLTGLFETSRLMTGRTFAGMPLNPKFEHAIAPLYDFGRMMGTSALLWEVGKDVLHADLSHGLAWSAMSDLFPGMQNGRFDQRAGPLPLPPIIDIPTSIFTGVVGGNSDLIRQQIMRVAPGGVAVSRLLGSAPKLPLPDPLNLQTTYVGWDRMVTGPKGERLVPVFKGDGTLIDWQNPSAVVLKALGADLGGRTATLDVDRYIMQQSDLIRQYRGEALTALMAGNTDKFKAIQDEFKTRTGLPLTISNAHIASAIKQREVPRYERVLGRIPQDLRGPYQRQLQGQAEYRSGIEGLPGSPGLQRPQAQEMTAGEARSLVGDQQTAENGYSPYSGFTP